MMEFQRCGTTYYTSFTFLWFMFFNNVVARKFWHQDSLNLCIFHNYVGFWPIFVSKGGINLWCVWQIKWCPQIIFSKRFIKCSFSWNQFLIFNSILRIHYTRINKFLLPTCEVWFDAIATLVTNGEGEMMSLMASTPKVMSLTKSNIIA